MLEMLYASEAVGCDCETTGLNIFGKDRPFAFSFTTKEGVNAYVRFSVNPFTREVDYQDNREAFAAIKSFCETPHITKVFHNANFDILMLKQIGIEVKGPVFDTYVMAHVHNPSRFSYALKPLAKDLLGYPMDDQKDLQADVVEARREGKKRGYMLHEDVEGDYWLGHPLLCEKYAVGDTERTMGLYLHYLPYYQDDPKYHGVVDMEMEVLEVVRRMMERGHKVDLGVVDELEKYYGDQIAAQEVVKANLGYADLNVKSGIAMRKVFYEDLKLPVQLRSRKKKTANGIERTQTPSTDTEALNTWANEGNALAECLVELSAARYQLTSFILPFKTMANNGVLHPSYKTLGAITGRMSCTKPNLMNIPDDKSGKRRSDLNYRARECFVPRDGHLLYYADYTQIEVWVAAFMSQDKLLIQQLMDGADMHGINAKAYWGHLPDFEANFTKYRKKAKTVTFGSLYGAGKNAIAAQAEVTVEEAARIHRLFWETYQGLWEFNQKLQRRIKRDGYVYNPFGRRYFVDPNFAYKAMNYMVQGSSCEVLKRAVLNVDKLYKARWPGCHPLMLIHDEKVSEIPVQSHSRLLMTETVQAMQGDFHKIFGMPNPFKIGMSFSSTSWAEKTDVESSLLRKAA